MKANINMRFLAVTTALYMSAPGWAAAQSTVENTVSVLSKNNGLVRNGWLVVRTPSILQMQKSFPVQADERAALANYDTAIALPGAPATRAEAMRRAAWMRIRIAQRVADPRSKELTEAIALYRRMLAEFPADKYSDEGLYQLAHALQMDGQNEAAADSLVELTTRFRHSELTADAAFRAGELLYARGLYEKAQAQYEIALDSDQHIYTEPLRYKLAWSLYKQARYDKAIALLITTLDTYLPPGELDDPKAALALVQSSRSEITADSLRLVDMAFIAMKGAEGLNLYFTAGGKEPRFSTLLYTSVAAQLISRQRFADAAAVNSSFVARHPDHILAPRFLEREIAALEDGGFGEQVMRARVQYVEHLEPGAAYWHGKAPSASVLTALHDQLQSLAHDQHSRAQTLPTTDKTARENMFADATVSYRKLLKYFPNDPTYRDIQLQLADALLESGKIVPAAEEYHLVAYGPTRDKNTEVAAFAEVQAYQQLAVGAKSDAHLEALQASVRASITLAESFPNHPQRNIVIVKAAQDVSELGDYQRAIELVAPLISPGLAATGKTSSVTAASTPLNPALRIQALNITASAYFARNDFAHAESSYRELLSALADGAALRTPVIERLVQAIYKQGEIARDAGNLRLAATTFLRVGEVSAEGPMRVAADYDAAHALMTLEDWPAAENILEGFRKRNPTNKLAADVDKLLGDAYFSQHKYADAGLAYARVSANPGETNVIRTQAAWRMAQSYDFAHDEEHATSAYTTYLSRETTDIARGITARERLAQLARGRQDAKAYQSWLTSIIQVDATAGAARDETTRHSGANASLALAQIKARTANSIVLALPLKASLQKRQGAMQEALSEFDRAAAYSFSDVTTAAAFEEGQLYRDFSAAITHIPVPSGLAEADIAAYRSALASEAQQFDEKAIAAFKTNLDRVNQGVWNDAIRKSAMELAQMAPAIYDKSDELENTYANFR